nr:MAG TPA: hypothetical protein [Bacteriophage sp.]
MNRPTGNVKTKYRWYACSIIYLVYCRALLKKSENCKFKLLKLWQEWH